MNEYASWSIALRSMIKNREKFLDYEIGKKSDGDPLKLREWLEIPNNYFTLPKTLEGNFKKTFKFVDLGGGDQQKILDNNEKTIADYKNKTGILTTGGDNETRSINLSILHNKLYTSGESISVINALDLDMETKLTAASYYEKAQTFFPDFDKVCLIPIGSTDLHVIIYEKDNSVTLDNLSNYRDKTRAINLNNINDKTLIVFAGSARYYLHQIYGTIIEKKDNPSTEFQEAVETAKAVKNAPEDEKLKSIYNLTEDPKLVNLFMLKDISIHKNAETNFNNNKIRDFTDCLNKINFKYRDNIHIMIGKGEEHAINVGVQALQTCLDASITSRTKGGKNTKKKKKKSKKKKSRKRVKKNKRSTKKR